MKMNFWTLLAGGFFVLLGCSILLRVMGIHFPFMKIVFGLVVIVIGVGIIFPKFFVKCAPAPVSDGRNFSFGEGTISGEDVQGEYNVSFGAASADLTQIKVKKEDVKVKINAAFGGVEILIKETIPMKIKAGAAFGGVELPGNNATAFGETSYKTSAYIEGKPAVLVEITAAFGGVEVKSIK